MNRSYSLTSASKPPKQCLMNCLFNRDKLKLSWSCARLSKCSASGYRCCTTPGLWTKRCPQGQQFRGGTIGRVKTDRMPGWSDVNWEKFRKFLSLFHLGLLQMCFLPRSTLPHLLQALHVLQQQFFHPGRICGTSRTPCHHIYVLVDQLIAQRWSSHPTIWKAFLQWM